MKKRLGQKYSIYKKYHGVYSRAIHDRNNADDRTGLELFLNCEARVLTLEILDWDHLICDDECMGRTSAFDEEGTKRLMEIMGVHSGKYLVRAIYKRFNNAPPMAAYNNILDFCSGKDIGCCTSMTKFDESQVADCSFEEMLSRKNNERVF
jgi:hypothetical protein